MPRRVKNSKLNDFYGVLPDWAIKDYIKSGIIKITPLFKDWEDMVGPVTIDFRLGTEILVPKAGDHWYVDVKRGVDYSHYDKIILKEDQPHIMMPNQFIIAPTMETLELPKDIIGRLEGKSSLARLGIVVHLTSGRFDPGWYGPPVLELKNNSQVPVIIYGGWPICAFSFERMMAEVDNPYTAKGRYVGSVIHSLIEKDGKKKE